MNTKIQFHPRPFPSYMRLFISAVKESAEFLTSIFSKETSKYQKKIHFIRILSIVLRFFDSDFLASKLIGLDEPSEDWRSVTLSQLFRLSTNFAEPLTDGKLSNFDVVMGKGEVRRARKAFALLKNKKNSVQQILFFPSVDLQLTSGRSLRIYKKAGIVPSKTFVVFDHQDPLLSLQEVREIVQPFAGYYINEIGDYTCTQTPYSLTDCLNALICSGDIRSLTAAGATSGRHFIRKCRRALKRVGIRSQLLLAEHQQFQPGIGTEVENERLFDEVFVIQDPDGHLKIDRYPVPLFKKVTFLGRTDYQSTETIGTNNHSVMTDWVIDALTKLPAGAKLLDAGAGERRYRSYCSHLKYTSQDFDKYDGQGDGKGLHTGNWVHEGGDIVSDITQIPVPDFSFDAVLCTEVFEHLPDPVKALTELARVLKPGGTLIVSAPFCSLTHFAPFHFSTGFNRYFYEHHFALLGLKPKVIKSNGGFFDYLSQEILRLPIMSEKYAGAPLPFSVEAAGLDLVEYLATLKKNDKESAELLCYGYFVIAEKL